MTLSIAMAFQVNLGFPQIWVAVLKSHARSGRSAVPACMHTEGPAEVAIVCVWMAAVTAAGARVIRFPSFGSLFFSISRAASQTIDLNIRNCYI